MRVGERLGRSLLCGSKREVAMGAETVEEMAGFRTCFDGRV